MAKRVCKYIYKIVSVFLVLIFLFGEITYSYAQPIDTTTLAVQSNFSIYARKKQSLLFEELICKTIENGIKKGYKPKNIRTYLSALLEEDFYRDEANYLLVKRMLVQALKDRDIETAQVLTLLLNDFDANMGTLLIRCPKGDYSKQAKLFEPFRKRVMKKLQSEGDILQVEFLTTFIFEELLPNIVKHGRDNLSEDIEEVFGFFAVDIVQKKDGKYLNFYMHDNGGGAQLHDTVLQKGLVSKINTSMEDENLETPTGRGLFLISRFLFSQTEKGEFYFQSQGKRADILGVDQTEDGKLIEEIRDADFHQGFCAGIKFKFPENSISEQSPLGKVNPSQWITERPVYQVILKDYSDISSKKHVFRDVAKDIPLLAQKNIGTLWLTGLMKNLGAIAPFEVMDPMAIEERYGTMDDLEYLIQTAHEYGLKVITDFIPNHVSMHSPLAKEHPEWFLHDSKGDFIDATDNKKEGYAWKGLLQFDYSNPELIQYLHDVGAYWMHLGLDGFRLDTPLAPLKEVMIKNWFPNRSAEIEELFPQEFWKTFIERLRQINPEAGFIAETLSGEKREELLALGVDLVYDSGLTSILYEILKGKNDKSPSDLQQYLVSEKTQLGASVHFKDGHDIRDIGHQSEYGIEKLRFMNEQELLLAMTLILTLPGVPMFFNGELEAVENYAYEANGATPIPWDTINEPLKVKYNNLLERLNIDALRKGDIAFPKRTGAETIIGFSRTWKDQIYLVAANLSRSENNEKQWATIFLDQDQKIVSGKKYIVMDALTDEVYGVHTAEDLSVNGLAVGVENHGFQVLKIVDYEKAQKSNTGRPSSLDEGIQAMAGDIDREKMEDNQEEITDDEEIIVLELAPEQDEKGEMELYRESLQLFRILIRNIRSKEKDQTIKAIICNLRKTILLCTEHRFPTFIKGHIERTLEDPQVNISEENKGLLAECIACIDLREHQAYRKIVKYFDDIEKRDAINEQYIAGKLEEIIRALPEVKVSEHVLDIKNRILCLLNDAEFVKKYLIKTRLIYALEAVLRLEFASQLSQEKEEFFGKMRGKSTAQQQNIYLQDIDRGAIELEKISSMWNAKSLSESAVAFDRFVDERLKEIMATGSPLSYEQRIRFYISLTHLRSEYLGIEQHLKEAENDPYKLLEVVSGVKLSTGLKEVVYSKTAPYMLYFDFETRGDYINFVKRLHAEDDPESRQGEYRRSLISAFGFSGEHVSPYKHELNHAFFNAVSRSIKDEIEFSWNRASFKELLEVFIQRANNFDEKGTKRVLDAIFNKVLHELSDEFIAFYMDGERLSVPSTLSYYFNFLGCFIGEKGVLREIREHLKHMQKSSDDIVFARHMFGYLKEGLDRLSQKIRTNEKIADILFRVERPLHAASIMHMMPLNKVERLRYFYKADDVVCDIEELIVQRKKEAAILGKIEDIDKKIEEMSNVNIYHNRRGETFFMEELDDMFSKDENYRRILKFREKKERLEASLKEATQTVDISHETIIDKLTLMFIEENPDNEGFFEDEIEDVNSPFLEKFIRDFIERAQDEGIFQRAKEALKWFLVNMKDIDISRVDNIFSDIEKNMQRKKDVELKAELLKHSRKYLSKISVEAMTPQQNSSGKAIVLYADDMVDNAVVFDIEVVFEKLSAAGGVLHGGTVILYTSTNDVDKRAKVQRLKEIIQTSCDSDTSVKILDKVDVWGLSAGEEPAENVTEELEHLFYGLRSRQSVKNKIGSFFNQEDIIGVILGSKKGLMEICSQYYTHKVPIVMLNGIKNGNYGIFSFAQAVSFVLEMGQARGSLGWVKVLYPIEVTEDLRDNYMRYRKEVLVRA